jgi:TPR repeat protein
VKKIIMNFVALTCCAIFSVSALADADEQTAEQVYNKIKYIQSLPSLAPWLVEGRELLQQTTINAEDSLKTTYQRDNEISRLKKSLETKVNHGEPIAMFYAAMLKEDDARFDRAFSEKYQNMSRIKDSNEKYDLAIQLFKQAGDAGINAAYWNVAVAYENGFGNTTSKLAAIEWYYKAGVGYLKDGYREQALAALEAIQAIRMDSELGLRLEKELNKGAPK